MIAEAAALAQAGELARSLSLLAQRLGHDPDNPELHYAQGLTLSDWGRWRESLESLRAAESRGWTGFGLQLNTAQLCLILGFEDEAEQRARQAVGLDPTAARAHLCLATVLRASRRYDEAVRAYEQAFALAPDSVECLVYIAACKLDQNDATGAEALIRRAISVAGGDQAKTWALLGSALSRQGRRSEALEAFDRAEEIEDRTGERAETFVHHGFDLVSFGRVSEAIELYERQLPSQPNPLAQAHYGFALLTAGRYREGWEQYEFRRFVPPELSRRLSLGRPTWNGQCLEGKTLLVSAEQGIGDTIQFARFARQLKSSGATVILQVREKLKPIAADLDGVDRVVLVPSEVDTPLDYHIAMMSLPRVLCPDVASIPAVVPYLRTDPLRVQQWRGYFGAGTELRVGVVWAGNPEHERDRQRSIALSALMPLWDIEGVRYFSLQKEQRDDDSRHFPTHGRLIDLASQLHDLRDTAAAIEALDLVIAVDTAVAHIAGALGKPVWVLLPAAGDFRWLMDRDDSPWYPTMRLFRQQQFDRWDEVVCAVAQALRIAVETQRAGKLLAALLPVKTTGATGGPSVHRANERLAAVPALSRVVETRYGIMQYVPQQSDTARSIGWYGEWLQAHVKLLGTLLRPGATILEAASGIGAHVLALAQMNGPDGHVLAYEKDPLLRRILLQNIQANRFGRVVTVMQRHLGGSAGSEGVDLAATTADDRAESRAPDTESIDELRLAHLDLIKLNDCRAARTILDGAAATLWRLRPKLFLAEADAGNLAGVVDHVRSFGYRCWHVESRLYQQDNFNGCDRDIFPARKAVALVAIPEESDVDLTAAGCVELAS